MDMDYDGQRLLDVINDPNALESFLGESEHHGGESSNSAFINEANQIGLEPSTSSAVATAAAITQEQLASLQLQIQQQQQQLEQLTRLQFQQEQQQLLQQQHSPFSVPVRSPAPGTSPAATVILRSPAAPPPAASPSPLASSPAPSTLSHANVAASPYSVSSPAPAPSPGPTQFYRTAPSPQQQQQQRSNSLSSTPVASPINYPPGPGPGSGQPAQSVQLPAGTITIPALATAVGQVQQLVSGGQVLQILSTPAAASSPQMAGNNSVSGVVRHPVANVRVKQPQLRPKPANTSSPGPAQTSPAMSPRTSSPVIVHQQPQQSQAQSQQLAMQQQSQQLQQSQPQVAQTPQVVQLGAGGPTGTLVFSGGGNPVFPALAPTGGQFFLQQQGNGGFQLIVRPPVPSASPPRQQSIVVQPQLGPTVHLTPTRPATVAAAVPQPCIAQQPMVRLVTLPGLGTVQLQQIQTPNGPAFLAVQQPQQATITTAQPPAQQPAAFLRAAAPTGQATTYIQQSHLIAQPQPGHMVTQQSATVQQPTPQQQPQAANQNASIEANNDSSNTTFATPPVKKPPAKKKPPSKSKKKIEPQLEEKKPAVNLEELLKQTGIVGDDDSFFMEDEQSPAPTPVTSMQVQSEPPGPAADTKENAIESALISEANILQTLQQHGLALASDDLITLRNFIKPSETNEHSSALGSDQIVNGIKGPIAKPTVSLTLGNGQVIQLTEPFGGAQSQGVQFVAAAPFDPSQATQVFHTATAPTVPPASTPAQTTEIMQQQPTSHGFQNEFLEDLARSQIVSDPKKTKKQATPARNATSSSPAVVTTNNNTAPKKKAPAKKKPPVKANDLNASQTVVVTLTGQTGTTTTSSVTRVQTIKLSPQNQQNLRNIQAQIQYLTSKKDPTPQETTLLQKLIEHHQNILATGKPVPTIPGQHAQGISFNPSSGQQPNENSFEGTPALTTGSRSQNKVSAVPANIQQNTHLANLLRQPVADKSPRVTTTQQGALRQVQPTAIQQQRTSVPTSSVSITPVTGARFVVPVSGGTTVVTPVSSNGVNSAGITLTTSAAPSSIQTPVGTLVLTVVDGQSPSLTVTPTNSLNNTGIVIPTVDANGATTVTPVINSLCSSNTPTASSTTISTTTAGALTGTSTTTISSTTLTSTAVTTRGIKRPAAPAPKPTISKNSLFEHQLKTDQNGALTPDCRTPFKNKTNACKRLIRYHVFHELDPSPSVIEKEEDELEDRAQQLLSKFHQMINKYHHLLMVESTKEAPASEYVMVERMFVSEEKQSLERLKEEARVAKELNLTPVWPVKTEPGTTPSNSINVPANSNPTPSPSDVVVNVNGQRDSPCDEAKATPKMGLLRFTRKDGESYRSEIQEHRESKPSIEELKNSMRIKEAFSDRANHTIMEDKLAADSISFENNDTEVKPYDEWEAIQRELALYPDTREKDEMDFGSMDGDGVMYDDDIKAQMQNAIDDLLKLNGCDDIPPSMTHHSSSGGPTTAGIGSESFGSLAGFAPLKNGEQYSADMQVDLALNEAVNSIL